MTFARPTLAELHARVQADVQGRANGGNPYLRGAPENAFAWALAGTAHGLHGHIAANARFLPTNCDADRLAEWGELYDLPRKSPTPASRLATFTGSDGAELPAGAVVVRADGVRYVVQATEVVAGGTVTVEVRAELAGTAGNTDGAAPVQLASPEPGISTSGVFVAESGVDGTDVEDLEVWRDRILLRMRNPPRGGSTADYEVWTRSTPGVSIRNVFVRPHRRGVGTVDVAFTVFGADPIPSPGQVALVQAQLDGLRPKDMAGCLVYAPTAQVQPYTIAVRPYTAAVRAAVEGALDDLHTREALMGTTLLISHVRQAISDAEGEFDHELAVPSANVVPTSPDHIVLRGPVSWSELEEP